MAKGSDKGSRQVISHVYSGKASEVSRTSCKATTAFKRPSEQSQAYERTTRVKHEDKQSGSYERYTRKEKASSGDLHVEKGSGRVGVKDEFTKQSTIKIGNKSGYTEYHTEERVRNVNFGTGSGGGSDGNGPNNCLTYHDNSSYGNNNSSGSYGYNYDDDNSGPGYDDYSDDDY
ncbi:hypothetical protein LOK49_LG05G02125 [Camellia lanceoleosa]|uniref:Uncharacterized protein n=1 Tax=Camellia lanceoleosa TaxID=1840588 RepID=A0ACC0HTC1_9ERIC|nr:hypothetical protein LOK49_LG05G02125 [Camellia lanceoleosa]